MKKFIITLTLVTQSSYVLASEDWFEMGRTDESSYSINIPSLSETTLYGNKVVKSWIKEVIVYDITKDGLSVNDHIMLMYYSNCKENTLGLKSQTMYRKSKVFGQPINKSYVQMQDVIPGSIGQKILTYSCNGMEIKNSNQGDN